MKTPVMRNDCTVTTKNLANMQCSSFHAIRSPPSPQDNVDSPSSGKESPGDTNKKDVVLTPPTSPETKPTKLITLLTTSYLRPPSISQSQFLSQFQAKETIKEFPCYYGTNAPILDVTTLYLRDFLVPPSPPPKTSLSVNEACQRLGIPEGYVFSQQQVSEQYKNANKELYARNMVYGIWLNEEAKLRDTELREAVEVLRILEEVVWVTKDTPSSQQDVSAKKTVKKIKAPEGGGQKQLKAKTSPTSVKVVGKGKGKTVSPKPRMKRGREEDVETFFPDLKCAKAGMTEVQSEGGGSVESFVGRSLLPEPDEDTDIDIESAVSGGMDMEE